MTPFDTSAIEMDHHGYTARVDWREEFDGWRAGWWLKIGQQRAQPIGEGERGAIVDQVRSKWIGDPPPADHRNIWGGYTCGSCKATGVKLWRDYQTFLDGQTLRCRPCCEAHEGKMMPANGDQIGWSVPAVPTPDGSTFWGYSSVPLAAVAWWRALPFASNEARDPYLTTTTSPDTDRSFSGELYSREHAEGTTEGTTDVDRLVALVDQRWHVEIIRPCGSPLDAARAMLLASGMEYLSDGLWGWVDSTAVAHVDGGLVEFRGDCSYTPAQLRALADLAELGAP